MHAEYVVRLREQTLFTVGDVEIRRYACAHGEEASFVASLVMLIGMPDRCLAAV
jgi:hypothetical protein